MAAKKRTPGHTVLRVGDRVELVSGVQVVRRSAEFPDGLRPKRTGHTGTVVKVDQGFGSGGTFVEVRVDRLVNEFSKRVVRTNAFKWWPVVEPAGEAN